MIQAPSLKVGSYSLLALSLMTLPFFANAGDVPERQEIQALREQLRVVRESLPTLSSDKVREASDDIQELESMIRWKLNEPSSISSSFEHHTKEMGEDLERISKLMEAFPLDADRATLEQLKQRLSEALVKYEAIKASPGGYETTEGLQALKDLSAATINYDDSSFLREGALRGEVKELRRVADAAGTLQTLYNKSQKSFLDAALKSQTSVADLEIEKNYLDELFGVMAHIQAKTQRMDYTKGEQAINSVASRLSAPNLTREQRMELQAEALVTYLNASYSTHVGRQSSGHTAGLGDGMIKMGLGALGTIGILGGTVVGVVYSAISGLTFTHSLLPVLIGGIPVWPMIYRGTLRSIGNARTQGRRDAAAGDVFKSVNTPDGRICKLVLSNIKD